MNLTVKEYDLLIEAADCELKQISAQYDALLDRKNELISLKRRVCPHNNTEERDGYDQHNGIDWTEVYCVDCGSYLRRY